MVQHARRRCTPEVRVCPLKRQYEYVPGTRQVQQGQDQSEDSLPPSEFADRHGHRIIVRFLRPFIIFENSNVT